MSGQLSVPQGITATRCTSCGADVLHALTRSGIDVQVDAAPLTPRGELDACVAGCATYTRHVVAGELSRRYPLLIRNRPAGTIPRQTVHPQHQCRQTWQAAPPEQLQPAAATTDAPPF